MKGAPGLILAIVLGLAGVALNWLYLQNKAAQVESISFLGVGEGVQIPVGQPIRESDMVEVKIPKNHARGLEHFVYLYKDMNLLVGTHATRKYEGGELLRLEDYRTPPAELKLDRTKKEMLMWVSVDTSSFVSDLLDPGDKITFLVPPIVTQNRTPTPAAIDDSETPMPASAEPVMRGQNSEAIGPFVVAAVGNRLGSFAITKANQYQPAGGNVIGIIVHNEGTEDEPKLESKANRLNSLLQANPSLRARVVKHSR